MQCTRYVWMCAGSGDIVAVMVGLEPWSLTEEHLKYELSWIHFVHEQEWIWADLCSLGLLFQFCSTLHPASIFEHFKHHLSSSFFFFSFLLAFTLHPSCQNLSVMLHRPHKPSCASPPDIHRLHTGGSKPLPAPTHLLTGADTPVHQQEDRGDATTHLCNRWQLLLQHAAQQQGSVLHHKVSWWLSKWAISWERLLVGGEQLMKHNQKLEGGIRSSIHMFTVFHSRPPSAFRQLKTCGEAAPWDQPPVDYRLKVWWLHLEVLPDLLGADLMMVFAGETQTQAKIWPCELESKSVSWLEAVL